VMVMVGPRAGDFAYDAADFAAMRRDVDSLRESGVAGVVFGILQRDGTFDHDRMRELVSLAAPLQVTCHRAIDVAADPLAMLAHLVELGIDRVLTSGASIDALRGADAIARMVRSTSGRTVVMAGGGIRPDNVVDIVARTGVREVHLSATAWLPSPMTFHRTGLTMGTRAASEYELRATDAGTIRALAAALRGSGN
jgi:copper homeostasis protein